jgi:type I restriction enzyme S subunit
MGLKTFTTEFAELAQDEFYRNDEKYYCFLNSTKWNIFESKKTNLISLKDVLKNDYETFIFEEDEEYKGIPTGQSYIDEDGDIIDYLTITKEEHPARLKYKVSNENILISSLRLAKSPALYFENENLSNFVFSNGFYIFKVNENWNKRLILNILRRKRLKKVLDNNIYRGIGISAYKDDDLLKIKIPQIPKETQDQIVTQIEPIEQKIKDFKNQIQPIKIIINKVFAHHFDFDMVKFEELKKHTIFNLDFASFANNIDLRQSVKFHRKAGKFVLEQLKSKTDKKIKNFLSEPIVLGKGISPNEYDENGDIFYIAMSNIKNWQFEIEDVRTVSSVFANANRNKMVVLNDIILARSGEGTIGKVALIEDENLEGIFADFTMRIRLKDYNYLFAYFYFRTTYFQYLVEINKKGLGNNTNIFPSQIQEFPLFDISLIEQQQIVNEIKAELDKQENVKKTIAEERNKIDEIIENSIRDFL